MLTILPTFCLGLKWKVGVPTVRFSLKWKVRLTPDFPFGLEWKVETPTFRFRPKRKDGKMISMLKFRFRFEK